MKTKLSIKEMRRAVYRRDASYDGAFFVGVRTTSVFCRPSCVARKPLAANMMFFPSARDALFAGFRPCKRCRPLAVAGEPPDWVTNLLSRVDASPRERIRDGEIRTMGIDPARARRYFKQQFGITFQAYARARRLGVALEQIRDGASLDDVALGNGFESHSGFREAFAKTHGRPQAPAATRSASGR
jgi:AraC family transcriptional regulator of adaptative response/methylated-DNA-[protein]-cysteine methyltransferase